MSASCPQYGNTSVGPNRPVEELTGDIRKEALMKLEERSMQGKSDAWKENRERSSGPGDRSFQDKVEEETARKNANETERLTREKVK